MNKNKLIAESKSWSQLIIIVLLIRVLVFETFYIPSGSMNATLLEGDYIFATKYDYGYSNFSIPFSPNIISGRLFARKPNAGDIIIFRPPHAMKYRYIKRLIGLPGDKIQMINGVLHINGKKVDVRYVGKKFIKEGHGRIKGYNEYEERLPNGISYKILLDPYQWQGNSEVFHVPKGHYFFLGDNRNNSIDSRFELGYVPEANVIAKAKFIYFSTSRDILKKINSYKYSYNPLHIFTRFIPWITSIRLDRIGNSVYENI